MKLRLKEDPREWRKSVLLLVAPLALLFSFLRWRKVVSPTAWLALLGILACISVAAFLKARLFRGFYRVSIRAGVALSSVVARIVLVIIFAIVVIPLGLLLRLCGKDLLALTRPSGKATFWNECRKPTSLDRMF